MQQGRHLSIPQSNIELINFDQQVQWRGAMYHTQCLESIQENIDYSHRKVQFSKFAEYVITQ